MQLVDPEQSQPKSLEIIRFVALQRDPGSDLQAFRREFAAIADTRIARVTNDDTRRLKSWRRYAVNAPGCQQGTNLVAKFLLFGAEFFEAVFLRFLHDIARFFQRVGWQCRMVCVRATFIRPHNFEPLSEVTGEACTDSPRHRLQRSLTQHDERGTR